MNSVSKLKQSLGLRYVIVVVIANIIGSGVYKKVAPMAAELDSSAWVLIAWAVAGLITLMGALCNAEIAGLLADTGGEYAYYKKIYNKFFAFMFGWSLFTVIQTAAISSIAYVFAQSLDSIVNLPQLFPELAEMSIGGIFYPFAGFSVKLAAILLIIILSWVNTRGIKTGAGLSNAILLMVFTGIALIIFFGMSSKSAEISQSIQFNPLSNSPVTVSALFTAMLAAFWAYQGWYSIGFIGGEIKDAKRTLPKGVVIGVFIVIGIYLLVNATYLSLLSIPALNEIYQSGNQIAAVEAVRSFWGNQGALFISVLILITTLGCTNASILTGARPYYAMAREGMFFAPVARLNDKQTPVNSLTYQCVWACVLVLSGSFDQLTDMVIFAVFVYYGATAAGVFILRYKMPDADRPYKVWGYPIVPAIFILFCVALFLNTFYTRPREAAIGVVLMLTGIPMYFWFKRKQDK
ncbi:APC family permease [Daejeonella oryzae]|uniref:APC family permease n=1 Tax=Daejeonella oryzae TaxID=1122943 RepID=UPI00042953A1|nr:amino acid permease [Daejeonella oryzae]